MNGVTLMVPSYHYPGEEARCHRCRDIQWVRVKIPDTHEDLRRCPDCQGEDIANKRLAASGLGEGAAHRTLGSFKPNVHPATRRAHTAAVAYLKDGALPWLIFSGGVGCGKTHLSRGIGHALIEAGWFVKYMKAPALADAMRATNAPDSPVSLSEYVDRLSVLDYLILDDMGMERHTEFSIAEFERMLDYRYENKKHTIISTNLTREELARVSPRLVSRMLDRQTCEWVDMTGAPDYRLKAS